MSNKSRGHIWQSTECLYNLRDLNRLHISFTKYNVITFLQMLISMLGSSIYGQLFWTLTLFVQETGAWPKSHELRF